EPTAAEESLPDAQLPGRQGRGRQGWVHPPCSPALFGRRREGSGWRKSHRRRGCRRRRRPPASRNRRYPCPLRSSPTTGDAGGVTPHPPLALRVGVEVPLGGERVRLRRGLAAAPAAPLAAPVRLHVGEHPVELRVRHLAVVQPRLHAGIAGHDRFLVPVLAGAGAPAACAHAERLPSPAHGRLALAAAAPQRGHRSGRDDQFHRRNGRPARTPPLLLRGTVLRAVGIGRGRVRRLTRRHPYCPGRRLRARLRRQPRPAAAPPVDTRSRRRGVIKRHPVRHPRPSLGACCIGLILVRCPSLLPRRSFGGGSGGGSSLCRRRFLPLRRELPVREVSRRLRRYPPRLRLRGRLPRHRRRLRCLDLGLVRPRHLQLVRRLPRLSEHPRRERLHELLRQPAERLHAPGRPDLHRPLPA
ncbi:unnamed protein product, partial [Ectocarpus sp. 13 AM-2016]